MSILIVASCSQESLENTLWEFPLGNDCINYLKFSSDSVKLYDCELDEIVTGTYRIKHDTIIINTLYSEYDSEFPEGSRHRHNPDEYSLLKVDHRTISNPKLGSTYTLNDDE